MVVRGIASAATIVGMIWWSKRSDRLKERKLHTLQPLSVRRRGLDAHRLQQRPAAAVHRDVMASAGDFAAMVIFCSPLTSQFPCAGTGDCGHQCDRYDRRGAGTAVDGLAERGHGKFQRRYLYDRRVPCVGRGGDCLDSDENGGETKRLVSAERLIFPVSSMGRCNAILNQGGTLP